MTIQLIQTRRLAQYEINKALAIYVSQVKLFHILFHIIVQFYHPSKKYEYY